MPNTPKRKPNRAAPSGGAPEPTAALRKELSRRTKAELVDALLELAEGDRKLTRRLAARFGVAAAPGELVVATRRAIADATAFDKRDINRNFRYDYAAYEAVKRNLGKLVSAGQFGPAMELSLELMERGSHQVEMSDEGLMTGDIEDCLSVVLEALGKSELPEHKVIAWCSAMLEKDRVKFIATEDLQVLRRNFQDAAARQLRRD